jgi:hypothetical protein
VLRKKDNQVSFLHVYHHAGVFFGSWVITKFLPGKSTVTGNRRVYEAIKYFYTSGKEIYAIA